MTVHELVEMHLSPIPSASPKVNPSTKSGTTSRDASRLIATVGESKHTLTDILSAGTSEPVSLGSPNNLIWTARLSGHE